MQPIPVVAGDAHRAHDPLYELNNGEVVRPPYERPARVDALRAALAAAGHPLVAPAAHGLAPVLAVHERGLVEFLAGAHAAWLAAGGPPVLIPDTFATAALLGGRARATAAGLGRPGAWCFDTATPIVAGTFGAAVAAVDVALTGADLLAAGAPAAYALCRPPGHHAGPATYGGFCFLNNAAVAARTLGDLGRVAVVDVDFHHGNGTQEVFWEDPEVLYASIHGDPDVHYPYFSGGRDELGAGAGIGATRNFPLPDGSDDAVYLGVLELVIEEVDRFDPAVVVVSLGMDTHADDPIGSFALTEAGFAGIGRRLGQLGRPLLLVQEGGYALDVLGPCAVAALAGVAATWSGPP
jgi:acetoin utilization deacetylase AcuC-like enzyme